MRSCPVCHSPTRRLLYQHILEQPQRVFLCACGMIYAEGEGTVDYAADSLYTCAETYDAQVEHYQQIVERCELVWKISVLDIGCALGGLMQEFVKAGAGTVHGISLSQGEVDACRKNGLQAEVRSVSDPSAEYDLVTLSHVLEHVSAPIPFLLDLKRWVKRNGRVYIEIPDPSRYVTYFTSMCQGFNAEHINHFGMRQLQAICLMTGLEVIQSGSYAAAMGHERFYPVQWVLCELAQDTLPHAVEAYIEVLNKQRNTVQSRLAESLKGVSKLAMWGAGTTSKMLMANGVVDPSTLCLITDTNPAYHGTLIRGVMVVPPENFHPDAEVPILVCSQVKKLDILRKIAQLGLRNRLITLEDDDCWTDYSLSYSDNHVG